MDVPIVMVAFGTTTNALKTYAFIDKICKERFPDHEILWAYSSRMVKDWIMVRRGIELKHPYQVLSELGEKGYKWAVVQSLHLVCGHEFYRLVEEVKQVRMRTSIGLPLLTDPEDYYAVIRILGEGFSNLGEEAYVLVGHGTDHPVWASYLALHHLFRERIGPNIYVGVVEGSPSRDEIVDAVYRSGIKKARLIPFMLVAGTHFQEDLAGEEDSWKRALLGKGISVSVERKGLGFNPGIINLFCRHIEQAIDVIPLSPRESGEECLTRSYCIRDRKRGTGD